MDQLGVARRSIDGSCDIFVSALRSSGSKLPRHRFLLATDSSLSPIWWLGPLRDPAGINPLATNGSVTFLQTKKKTLNFKVFL